MVIFGIRYLLQDGDTTTPEFHALKNSLNDMLQTTHDYFTAQKARAPFKSWSLEGATEKLGELYKPALGRFYDDLQGLTKDENESNKAAFTGSHPGWSLQEANDGGSESTFGRDLVAELQADLQGLTKEEYESNRAKDGSGGTAEGAPGSEDTAENTALAPEKDGFSEAINAMTYSGMYAADTEEALNEALDNALGDMLEPEKGWFSEAVRAMTYSGMYDSFLAAKKERLAQKAGENLDEE